MEQTIWKFEIEIKERQQVSLPRDAEILSVQIDQKTNIPCIWAKVNPKEPVVKRVFEIIGTGHQMPDHPRKYIGTFQTHSGQLILHLFEITT